MSALFDPDTGELTEGGCAKCAAAVQGQINAEIALRDAEKELRRLRRSNANLLSEKTRAMRESVDGRTARALGRYWISRMGRNEKTSKIGDKRLEAVVARLRDGYEPSFIARAIDGLAVGAMTSDNDIERQALRRVMQEAVKMVSEEDAKSLRTMYREATKGVKVYDDLELVCRDETRLEAYHAIAERTQAPTLVGPAWREEFDPAPESEDAERPFEAV